MAETLEYLKDLLYRGRNITDFLTFHRGKAVKWQERTLKKLLFKARETEFGKQYQFDKILISGDIQSAFVQHVPIGSYSTMHPWWMREFEGESNLTWPGRPQYFALSSGTSEGSSKYIPVTDDQLRSMMRASRRQLLSLVKTDVPKDFLAKNYLLLGGSTNLNYNGVSYYGDLSGITTSKVPAWMERFTVPGPEITNIRDWHAKIDKIVETAPEWDVVMLAGGPAWVKILLEKLLSTYNLKNIHELWPNLSGYAWGAVALGPYKKQLDAMMGRPIMYFETYLASEGFIAFQTRADADGMKLAFRNNMYFEFVPFNEDNFDENSNLKPNAVAINISQVTEGVDYAILITTCSGAWRYMIGDTVRFTNAEACEIKITGRTKHFLSICGEHLSVDNMTRGVELTSEELSLAMPEFTVKGLKEGGTYGHHWFIACNNPNANTQDVLHALDKNLRILNDDYAIERDHVLKEMHVTLLPEQMFIDWLEKHGKLNGQSKFPKVLPDALYEDWLQFIETSKTRIQST